MGGRIEEGEGKRREGGPGDDHCSFCWMISCSCTYLFRPLPASCTE